MFEQKKYEEALEKAKEAVQCTYLSDTHDAALLRGLYT